MGREEKDVKRRLNRYKFEKLELSGRIAMWQEAGSRGLGQRATKRVRELRRELEMLMEEFEDFIAPLTEKEKTILRYKYIMGISWEEMPGYLHYSSRHCQRICHQAAEKLGRKKGETEG